MSRIKYSYGVVRVVPDVFSGEALNVAVIVLSSIGAHFRTTRSFARLKSAFPGISVPAIRQGLESLRRRLESSKCNSSIQELVCSIMPPDESSLQIEVFGGGITSDLETAIEELADRFTESYIERDFDLVQRGSVIWGSATTVMKSSNDPDWSEGDLEAALEC